MISTPLALFNGSYLGRKPTGIGVVARCLINSLDSELVHLLDPLGGSRPGSIPIPGNLMPEFGIKGHLRRLIWTQKVLPRLLRQRKVPLLLSPVPEAPIFRGVRSVVFAHDLIPLRYPQPTPLLAYHLTYVPIVLHRAVKVLCNSEATAREVHTRLGLPTKKLFTIPLGFDKQSISPLNLKRKPFFLVLGRHDPHKNIVGVLKALSLLSETEIEVWFVGPQDKRYTLSLKKIADNLGVSKRCRWIPWVSDNERLRLLNTCQALVIASFWEGFGLPALEAMACNTPVIASNAGALPEVVADAGLLVNPKNPGTIADAMKQIILSSSLRHSLVTRGQSRTEIYNWERSARLVESLLYNLCP